MIELTDEQALAIATAGEELVVVDPRTKQVFRLVREEWFQQMKAVPYDDSEWTPGEMAALAGAAFSQLDDTDYSEYLETP